MDHDFYMREAIAEAQLAEIAGEVPVGAVLVIDDQIIARAHNSPITANDPTAHAEINLLRAAARNLRNYRLDNATVYVTLEPCIMCAGALVHARVHTLVFGARDLRFGGVRSKFQLADSDILNHRIQIVEGVLAVETTTLLQNFFRSRR
ncbi:MAG: tRNA adenosine(34) deaminase TadA [Bryobacterales bacterium]|nr:tRNA adenosine(34) deaminase TadA [Bryobacterales bacterium]